MKIAKPKVGEPITLVMTATGEPRYRARVTISPRGAKVRRQRWSTHETLTDARHHIAAHKTAYNQGTFVALDRKNKSTFEDFVEAWITDRETSGKIRPNTAVGYRTLANKANGVFGTKLLADVTEDDIEALISADVAAGRTRRTASVRLFLVRSVFQEAIRQKVIAINPAAFAQARGAESKRREALTGEQLAKLRAHLAGDRLYAVWLLVLLGLRRSEVLGLTWADIDLEAKTLKIERSRVLVAGKTTSIGPTKTLRGRRVLPLPDDVLDALGQLRDVGRAGFGDAHAGRGYVVVDEIGAPLRHERLSDLWVEHCAAASVPGVTLHAARHSSVTAMREAGVPDYIVAAWHGHDEVVMKLTYTTAHPEAMAAAGNTLTRKLFGA